MTHKSPKLPWKTRALSILCQQSEPGSDDPGFPLRTLLRRVLQIYSPYLIVRVTVVVCVTPPPVAVIVMVRVPVLAVEATLISMPAFPAPGATMVVGLSLTMTPAPCPDADSAIAELKPPETAVVIFALPI